MKYESVKEALGKLVEWGGAGVGMLVGLASARYGLPVSPAVASTGGAIIGGMVGSQGKAIVVAGVDHLRERREERRTAAATHGDRPSARLAVTGTRHTAIRGPRTTSRRRGGAASVAGQVIGGIEQVIEQIERTAGRVATIHQKMWASQNALSAVLAGGRPDIVRTTEARLTAARGLVHDSAGALRSATDDLRSYRSRL
ncbi:hypothetical protein [Micromonospora marina]|uniref:hypothetical protein n=1 Tax=Micromonospora marina TaxID=307120 RepID=UPI003455293F